MWRQDKPDTIEAKRAAPVSREFMQKILATNILYRFMPFHYHNQWGLIPGATRWGDGGKKKERRILLILLPFCCHNFLPCKIIKISRLYDSLCSTLQINCSSFSGNLGNLSRVGQLTSVEQVDVQLIIVIVTTLRKFHWAHKCRVAFKGLIINANEWSLAVGQLCHFSPHLSQLVVFDSGSVLPIKLIQNTWKKLTNRIYDNPRHKLLSK